MIAVDTRTYKPGTTLGAPGVFGVSGKEPTAAKREEMAATGKDSVSSLVSQLADQYETLKTGGGITSPDQDTLSNIGAGIASSAPGQMVGRLVGTNNQSARNTISQMRPLLLNSIKQATGMSAKQMDSNAELKLYLSASTDPTLDFQANLQAMDNLDKQFGTGAVSAKLREQYPWLSKEKSPARGQSTSTPVPSGVDQRVWAAMTPQERSLWLK
jgi:hypothetical protein